MAITDLKQMCFLDAGTPGSEYDLGDNEGGSTSDSPMVLPVSLNKASFHLTALLRLLKTISATELPTKGATLRVEDVQRQLFRFRIGLRFHSPVWKIKNESICLIGMLINSQICSFI